MNLNPLSWWTSHGTKLLGLAQGTIATIAAIDGVIPSGQLKYYMAASAVLTFWRGFTNSAANANPPSDKPSGDPK